MVTTGTGVYLLFQSGYFQGIYTGYGNGAQLGVGVYTGHGDPFFFLSDYHVYLNWLLICFILAKVIDLGVVTELISLAAILGSFLATCYLYNFKVAYSGDESSYVDLIRITISFDYCRIWICMALIVLQRLGLYLSFRERRLRMKAA